MKAIYEAARTILYPNHHEHGAGVAFSQGINSYRASLRDALVAFEHANRGHRQLLDKPELSLAHAGRPAGPYSAKKYYSMRKKLRETTYTLVQTVIAGYPHPPVAALQKLLVTVDTQGWVRHFTKHKLYELCLQHRNKLGLHKDFYPIAQVEADDAGVVIKLEVNDALTGLKASRQVGPLAYNVDTINGVVAMLPVAKTELKKVFSDVLTWPEFAEREEMLSAYVD